MSPDMWGFGGDGLECGIGVVGEEGFDGREIGGEGGAVEWGFGDEGSFGQVFKNAAGTDGRIGDAARVGGCASVEEKAEAFSRVGIGGVVEASFAGDRVRKSGICA